MGTNTQGSISGGSTPWAETHIAGAAHSAHVDFTRLQLLLEPSAYCTPRTNSSLSEHGDSVLLDPECKYFGRPSSENPRRNTNTRARNSFGMIIEIFRRGGGTGSREWFVTSARLQHALPAVPTSSTRSHDDQCDSRKAEPTTKMRSAHGGGASTLRTPTPKTRQPRIALIRQI